MSCSDETLANELLDDRMMHWLAGAGASYGFELLGRHVLTYHKRLQAEQLPALLDTTAHFYELIPATIRDTRWSSPADGDARVS